jgi:2-iminobutanoate/2-iminopropanoate deaminase
MVLAGIGSEHEQTGKIMYPGDFAAQCRYAYRKLKKVLINRAAPHGLDGHPCSPHEL